MNNDATNGKKADSSKKTKYRVLGESGLVEDEDGNIISASEIEDYDESEKPAGDIKLPASFTNSSFVSSLDDKANPAHWYYNYDPRYCGPSREEYMEKMARKYRYPDNNEKEKEKEIIKEKETAKEKEKVKDKEKVKVTPPVAAVAESATEKSISVTEAAKKMADQNQREAERQGLRPDFHDYSTAMRSWGIVNRNNEVVVSYDEYSNIGYYHNGLARVLKKKTGKFGFVDIYGKEVIPCKWRAAGEFNEYMAGVQDDYKKCGYIDVTGRIVISCVWENGWPFNDGLAKVQAYQKIGMIDQRGKVVIPCIWKGMGDFSEGLAGVQDSDGKCGYIDIKGKVVIPCRWKNVWTFSEGLAVVQDFNKRLGFINKSGELVIPCQWKKVDSFKNGLARVLKTNRFFGKDKWVYIDKNGLEVTQP